MAMTHEEHITGAVELLLGVVDKLRDKKVHHFKGQLLNQAGVPCWDIDMTFERPTPKRDKDEE